MAIDRQGSPGLLQRIAAWRWLLTLLFAIALILPPSLGTSGAGGLQHAPGARKTSEARIWYADGGAISADGAGAHPIRSVLNFQKPLRFGQFIWDQGGVPDGPLWVRVDLSKQTISVFRGGHELGTAVILYGTGAFPTPKGDYPVLAKIRDHRSSLYDASMPFTLRLTHDGVSIHASDVKDSAATHGCIGVPAAFARLLFDQIKLGDVVTIKST